MLRRGSTSRALYHIVSGAAVCVAANGQVRILPPPLTTPRARTHTHILTGMRFPCTCRSSSVVDWLGLGRWWEGRCCHFSRRSLTSRYAPSRGRCATSARLHLSRRRSLQAYTPRGPLAGLRCQHRPQSLVASNSGQRHPSRSCRDVLRPSQLQVTVAVPVLRCVVCCLSPDSLRCARVLRDRVCADVCVCAWGGA